MGIVTVVILVAGGGGVGEKLSEDAESPCGVMISCGWY